MGFRGFRFTLRSRSLGLAGLAAAYGAYSSFYGLAWLRVYRVKGCRV